MDTKRIITSVVFLSATAMAMGCVGVGGAEIDSGNAAEEETNDSSGRQQLLKAVESFQPNLENPSLTMSGEVEVGTCRMYLYSEYFGKELPSDVIDLQAEVLDKPSDSRLSLLVFTQHAGPEEPVDTLKLPSLPTLDSGLTERILAAMIDLSLSNDEVGKENCDNSTNKRFNIALEPLASTESEKSGLICGKDQAPLGNALVEDIIEVIKQEKIQCNIDAELD